MKTFIFLSLFFISVTNAIAQSKYRLFLYIDGSSEFVMKDIPQADFFEIKLNDYSCMIAAYDIRPDSSFDRYALKLTDGNVSAVSYGITTPDSDIFVGVEAGAAYCWIMNSSKP